MTRFSAWSAFMLVAALVAGCGPEKELPTDVPKAEDTTAPQQVAPAKSDPEAKAIADRALKAFTGDKPELLAKAKSGRLTLKGLMYAVESGNTTTDANRTVVAVWPDRFHFLNESRPGGIKQVVESWLRRPDLIVFNNGSPHPLANPADAEQNLASDVVGQIWMPLLLPVADPKAVVFDPQSITLEKKSLHRLKLSLGDFPVYQLTFDATTDALLRSEYTSSLSNVSRRTLMIYSDHKRGPDGLLLPHQFECRHNNAVVEKWTVEKWEFPDAIKDDEFSPPKQK